MSRRGLLAGATAALGAVAGCSSLVGSRPDGARPTATVDASRSGTATAEDGRAGAGPLTVQTPPKLTAVIDHAAGLWNANPSPTDDDVLWARLGARPDFEERVANRFARRAGIDSGGGRADPPFRVAVTAGEPGRETAAALLDGAVDVAGIDGSYTPPGPDPETYFGDRADDVARHHLAREGWVFVTSPALAESGVDALTPDRIASVYAGEVTNWRAFGGPDREPFVFLGPDVTGVDPAYEAFLRANGAVPAALDARYGRAGEFVAAAARRDDALGVVQARGVRIARERGVPTLDVIVDGTRRTPYDEGYPMTDDVHLYTLGDPDARGRAVLDLLASPFGQRALVGRELLPVDRPPGW